MKQRYIGRKIQGGPIFHFLWSSSEFLMWDVTQSLEDDKWHPVSFYSKSLNDVERNYEIHDKEMLAIIQALEEWHHFLEGLQHKFEIWTDYKNLEYFMTVKKLNQ